MRRVAIVMIAASLATGCAESATPDTRVRVDTLPGGMVRTMSSHPVDSGRWALTAVRDIQPAELAPGELFDPQDVVVADDGSVLVADTKPTVVKVYDPAGALVRVIGREGSGPGEFRAAYLAILGDTLVVQDAANTRATTFNWRTGDLLSERRTACCYYFPIGIDAAGHAAVRSIAQAPDSTWQGAQGFVRFAINGRDADTLFVPVGHDDTQRPWVVREGGRIRFSSVVPFQPRAFHQVDAAGRFLTGYSSEYVLRRTTNGLDTLALFGRDWTAAPVPPGEKVRIVERRITEVRQGAGADMPEANLRAAFDPTYIPDTRPAYEAFAVDAAGRTWVRRVTDEGAPVEFDLFDRDGRWLDVITTPASGWSGSSWRPVGWGRNEIAVMLEGEDGRPLVRVYRIEHG